MRRTDESLTAYARAVERLRPVLGRQPGNYTARQFLRNSHVGRANALDELGRPAEAVADWDRAIDLDDGPRRDSFRVGRVNSRIRAGQVAEAVAEAADLAAAGTRSGGQWYNLACVYAQASGQLPDKREEYAARAVELLGRAVAAGWRNREGAEADKALDPLRDRADFQKLFAALPYTAPMPQPKNRP